MLQGDTLQLLLLSEDMEGMKLLYCFWSLVTRVAFYNQGKVQLIRKVNTIICATYFSFF